MFLNIRAGLVSVQFEGKCMWFFNYVLWYRIGNRHLNNVWLGKQYINDLAPWCVGVGAKRMTISWNTCNPDPMLHAGFHQQQKKLWMFCLIWKKHQFFHLVELLGLKRKRGKKNFPLRNKSSISWRKLAIRYQGQNISHCLLQQRRVPINHCHSKPALYPRIWQIMELYVVKRLYLLSVYWSGFGGLNQPQK